MTKVFDFDSSIFADDPKLQHFKGKRVRLTITEDHGEVTDKMHGYYRSINRWLTKNTNQFGGYLEDDVHDFARNMFLFETKTFEYSQDGVVYVNENRVLLSSTDPGVGKKRFAEFITNWRDWLLYELGIETPDAEFFESTNLTARAIVIPTDDNIDHNE